MVPGIIIPADNTAPLETATLESPEDYQRAVGGWVEAVDIPDLGATMCVNEEGHDPRSAVQPTRDVPMVAPLASRTRTGAASW